MDKTNGEKALDYAKKLQDELNVTKKEEPEKISVFSKDDQPTYAGIATFLKSSYVKNLENLNDTDVAVLR